MDHWTLGFNWLPHSLISDLVLLDLGFGTWFFRIFGLWFFSDFGFGSSDLDLVFRYWIVDPSNQSIDITNVLSKLGRYKRTNAGFSEFMKYRSDS